MTPLNTAVAELSLAVATAERRARSLMAASCMPPSADDLHDHRTAVAGDLSDAIDRVVPGLGQRFMSALYPEVFSHRDQHATVDRVPL